MGNIDTRKAFAYVQTKNGIFFLASLVMVSKSIENDIRLCMSKESRKETNQN